MILKRHSLAAYYFFMKTSLLLILGFTLSGLSVFGQQPLFIPTTLSGTSIDLNLDESSVNFYPGASTQTFGANGDFLAPTLILDRYQQVTLNVNNNLMDTTTIHWHGMHVAPENDGGPHTPIPPGTTWSPSFEVKDWAATHWYHPHLHHHTNEQVLKGLAGMIIVRDPIESALSLPRTYGVDDIPLILQTRAFDANNQIVIHSALDTSVMVNGTIDPYVNVPAQMIRLRLLNGSSERVYELGFSANQTFQQIASDGGLLSTPVSLTRLRLAPGERAEIVVNFSGMEGQTTQLISYAAELPNAIYGAAQPGMGPGQTIPNYTLNPLNGSNFSLIDFTIGAQTANPVLSIPSVLITHNPWAESSASTTRTLTFSPQVMGPTAIQGPFLINMMPFDMMMINYYVPFEATEIWTLTNNTPIAHPFHIHNVPFYILDINGQVPPANLQGRKDVVLVPAGGGTVRFITKFEDFFNDSVPYMYHCHMLTHEDDGMMGQYIVSSPPDAGMEEVNTNDGITLFPNPAQDWVELHLDSSPSEIKLMDQMGREVIHLATNDSKLILDLHELKVGAYTLLTKSEWKISREKLVILH